MTQLTRFEALQLVRAQFLTDQAMAEFFGVHQTTVTRWLNQSKQLPAEHVFRAEELGIVSRHELRPDFWPINPILPENGFIGVDLGTSRVSFQNGRISQAQQADAA